VTNILNTFERDGYRFRMEHDRLLVNGPEHLMTPERLAELRQRKPALLAECRLRAFVNLVRATAACVHHILLHPDDVTAALDGGDIAELATIARHERQAWAALLAHRLTRATDGESVP